MSFLVEKKIAIWGGVGSIVRPLVIFFQSLTKGWSKSGTN